MMNDPSFFSALREEDPDVDALIQEETRRLEQTLDLIAAESLPSPASLLAQGSPFAIKAAEGYPGRRYHAGCAHADALETLAIDRARELFGADHANVQPHSGVSANLAVFFTVLRPGDRVLSMKLAHGGHLSHGDSASITGTCFKVRHYGVNAETEQIDYEQVERLAQDFLPRMIIAGASSYPRQIDYERFAHIARKTGAFLLTDMAHIAGLVAGRVIPSPVAVSDFVTFTTYKTLLGGRGGVILCRKEFAERIDKSVFPGCQGTPALNMIAAKAVCFKRASAPDFPAIQRQIQSNATALGRKLEARGYRLVTGGTDLHLILIDLKGKGLTGDVAETVLASVGLVTNRNVIPRAGESPRHPGGLRLGTTSVTVRGMKEKEMDMIARLIDTTLSHRENPSVLRDVALQVQALCQRFPAFAAA
jgi:glycine hydroxymethyltransferase